MDVTCCDDQPLFAVVTKVRPLVLRIWTGFWDSLIFSGRAFSSPSFRVAQRDRDHCSLLGNSYSPLFNAWQISNDQSPTKYLNQISHRLCSLSK